MKNSINIRLEQPHDHHEVELLTRESFWNVYRPCCTEHYVINQYRNNPDLIGELRYKEKMVIASALPATNTISLSANMEKTGPILRL